MSLNDVLKLTMEFGGGTFDRNLELVTPESGFAVGMVRDSYAVFSLDDLDDLNHSILTVLGSFPGAYVGTWLNDGHIHVDPVQIVENRADALELARKMRQKAIYNFSTGETINVPA